MILAAWKCLRALSTLAFIAVHLSCMCFHGLESPSLELQRPEEVGIRLVTGTAIPLRKLPAFDNTIANHPGKPSTLALFTSHWIVPSCVYIPPNSSSFTFTFQHPGVLSCARLRRILDCTSHTCFLAAPSTFLSTLIL